jgi:hypothetical protein
MFALRSKEERKRGATNMIRSLIEEAAALASLTLFIGMVVIWAQVIATL